MLVMIKEKCLKMSQNRILFYDKELIRHYGANFIHNVKGQKIFSFFLLSEIATLKVIAKVLIFPFLYYLNIQAYSFRLNQEKKVKLPASHGHIACKNH